jgi:serine phosphatase RsbU (regulator of sigma subunit)/anti-sigma regulatory factor (Ser/Thr protein kinase)
MTLLRSFWQTLTGQRVESAAQAPPAASPAPRLAATVAPLDLAPNDPLAAYFRQSSGVVEVERLNFDSPALRKLKAEGARLVVPLVNQGEVIGLINLGPRRSEQDYSGDDHGLLNTLATQASPALRVAQLVREQKLEAQERERMAQELRVARLIQQTLLPRELPALPGWRIAAHYQPARAVGGDFYDFIQLADGRLALLIGDVTDKGVPAALVMATTRAILRGAAIQLNSPGAVLERANELLCPDMPPNMFVTCLYAILDPASGRLQYANAGHDLPYWRTAAGVHEMRATGMPLGLLPGMKYDEREIMLVAGDSVLLYSDGLVEAHNARREMFGFPRLAQLLSDHAGGEAIIAFLLEQWAAFTGPGYEQEDDTTLVVLQRQHPLTQVEKAMADEGEFREDRALKAEGWAEVARFTQPSQPGNERAVMQQVAGAVAGLGLPAARLDRLKTAVAEATMNAIEHGNKNRADQPVEVRVLHGDGAVAVHITDHGGGQPVPEPATPDLDAKLAGLQSPRGWGLFLIQNLVDEMNTASDAEHHTVELIMRLGGSDVH